VTVDDRDIRGILTRGVIAIFVLHSSSLAHSREPAHDESVQGAEPVHVSSDRFERDTIAILKRLCRRPIEPALESELLADLGFDSLQVLELVGELEDHFNIAVPLNALTHIRTVGQVCAEVRRLVALEDAKRS
jgi:acyl carrier protein